MPLYENQFLKEPSRHTDSMQLITLCWLNKLNKTMNKMSANQKVERIWHSCLKKLIILKSLSITLNRILQYHFQHRCLMNTKTLHLLIATSPAQEINNLSECLSGLKLLHQVMLNQSNATMAKYLAHKCKQAKSCYGCKSKNKCTTFFCQEEMKKQSQVPQD